MLASIQKLKKLLHLIKNTFYLRALIIGSAAAIEHNAVVKLFRDKGVKYIVDVGANKGQFALVCRHYIPTASIVSIEPLHGPSSVFSKVFFQDNLTSLYNIALGTTSGEAVINISNSEDSSSLLGISDLQVTTFPGTHLVGKKQVRIARLDQIITINNSSDPRALKIDVQGFELEVLKGGDNTLKYFEYIYVECSYAHMYEKQALAHEVISYLRARNFVLIGIYNTHYNKRGLSLQSDLLFQYCL